MEPAEELSLEPDEHHRLSLAYQSLTTLPSLPSGGLRWLDLSHNQLNTLHGLAACPQLETLVADCNELSGDCHLPFLPGLRYLSLNHNRIQHLRPLLEALQQQCPGVRWLSLLGNEACPNSLRPGDAAQYTEYRLCVLAHLKTLTVIDSTRVTPQERQQAANYPCNLPGSLDDLVAYRLRRAKRLSSCSTPSLEEDSPGHETLTPRTPESPSGAAVVDRRLHWDAFGEEGHLSRLVPRIPIARATGFLESAVADWEAPTPERATKKNAPRPAATAERDDVEAAAQALRAEATEQWAAWEHRYDALRSEVADALCAQEEAELRACTAEAALVARTAECKEVRRSLTRSTQFAAALQGRLSALEARNVRLGRDLAQSRGHVRLLQAALEVRQEEKIKKLQADSASPTLKPFAKTEGSAKLQAEEIVSRMHILNEETVEVRTLCADWEVGAA